MNVQVEQVGDVTVLQLRDKSFDVTNASELKAELSAQASSARKVVLDFAEVDFIDSSGCGAIIVCLSRVMAGGGKLALCRVAPPIREMFEVIRLQRIVDIFDTREQALEALAGT